MKIRKAVFPAAGLGTRFLPATKSQPKEMLPLVDKPVIQYVIEEAMSSGIENIIIVTGRGKNAIEDHFDVSYELEKILESRGKTDLLEQVQSISKMVSVSYVRQKEALGLGHAILVAKHLVGNEPFAVLLGDDIIDAQVPCTQQMIEAFEKYGTSILATQRVDGPDISRYGVIKGEPAEAGPNPRTFRVQDLVEKPAFEEAPSNLAIIGRYILTPEIFDVLEQTGLVVQQQEHSIGGIQERLATTGFVFDSVVNGVFAIGLEDTSVSCSHTFPFCFCGFCFCFLVFDATTSSSNRLAGKHVEQLRPDAAAERFGFDGREDCGHVELLCDFGEECDVVDERRAVRVGDAKRHLRLVVNEDDSAVLGSIELMVV